MKSGRLNRRNWFRFHGTSGGAFVGLYPGLNCQRVRRKGGHQISARRGFISSNLENDPWRLRRPAADQFENFLTGGLTSALIPIHKVDQPA